jgi:hypothetical protein
VGSVTEASLSAGKGRGHHGKPLWPGMILRASGAWDSTVDPGPWAALAPALGLRFKAEPVTPAGLIISAS